VWYPHDVLNPELSVDVRVAGDRLVVTLAGELDLTSKEQLLSTVAQAIVDTIETIEVNVSGLRFCDSTGLATFLRLRRAAQADGRCLYLTEAPASLLTLLETTGLVSLLDPPPRPKLT